MEYFDDRDKQLLLFSVNNYLDKLNFVFKNWKYYLSSDLTLSLLKSDYKDLKKLRDKLFAINSEDYIIKIEEGS